MTLMAFLWPVLAVALQAMDVISNHYLKAGWIKGACRLHRTCRSGRQAHARKPALLLGFLFHFVKEKDYTQGTRVNKGHCSCEARSSLPFFIWTGVKADRVILSDFPSPAPLITDEQPVWSPASLPSDHLGGLPLSFV